CEAKPRSKIVAVGVNERLLRQISALRRDERAGLEIKVRPFPVSFPRRCRKLVSQTQIQREAPADLPIILREQKVHVLINVEGRVRILLVLRGETEQQIGDGIAPVIIDSGEAPGIIEITDQRADVADSRLHVQQLAAKLDRVRSSAP